MIKLYNKSELGFSLVFIAIYIVGASICDIFSDMLNISKVFTMPFLLILSLLLIFWINQNNLSLKYGLCKPNFKPKYFLFYIPLAFLISTNVWFGVQLNFTIVESILNVLAMLLVGFVEEIIFRGFLFKSLEKENFNLAIIVSSITFGFGHIINLFLNGPDHLLSNVCQIFYATAVGFLFVIMFYKGGSLVVCILTHSLVNALSVFQNIQAVQGLTEILISVAIIIVSISYAIILLKTLNSSKQKQEKE